MKIKVEFSVMGIEKELPDSVDAEELASKLRGWDKSVVDMLPVELSADTTTALAVHLTKNNGSFIDTVLIF